MAKEINRLVSCPSCRTQINVQMVDFSGQIRILCQHCNIVMGNWVEEATTPPAKQDFRSTQELQVPRRTHTAQRISVPPAANTAKQQPASQPVPQETIVNTQHKTSQETIVNIPQKAPAEPVAASQKMARIGDYQLVKTIGRGAMGEICLAQNVENNHSVAIKFLNQKLIKEKAAIDRFRQEARVHSRLNHPNIVRIYTGGQHANRLYLVMEYIEGESLEQILKARGSISPKHSLEITIAVARALEHALTQNIIHRDLKPANIMIDRRTRKVKLTDFGLGKILEEEGLTSTGQVMGTAYYMPPEQIRNAKQVNQKADIYSLGATLYHMLSGQPPYGEIKRTLSILHAKVTQEPIPISELVESIPQEVITVVETSMSRKIENRYDNPTIMISQMQNALQSLE